MIFNLVCALGTLFAIAVAYVIGKVHGVSVKGGTLQSLEKSRRLLFGKDLMLEDGNTLVKNVARVTQRGTRNNGVTIEGHSGNITLSYWQYSALLRDKLVLFGSPCRVVNH